MVRVNWNRSISPSIIEPSRELKSQVKYANNAISWRLAVPCPTDDFFLYFWIPTLGGGQKIELPAPSSSVRPPSRPSNTNLYSCREISVNVCAPFKWKSVDHFGAQHFRRAYGMLKCFVLINFSIDFRWFLGLFWVSIITFRLFLKISLCRVALADEWSADAKRVLYLNWFLLFLLPTLLSDCCYLMA